MIVEFIHNLELVGYLVMVEGRMPGLRIPFHQGVTFIGKFRVGTEFKNPEQLVGITEAAQIWIRYEDGRCWVTDATSTNLTSVFDHEPPTRLSTMRWMTENGTRYSLPMNCAIYGKWRIEF